MTMVQQVPPTRRKRSLLSRLPGSRGAAKLRAQKAEIESSGMFDAEWYRRTYRSIAGTQDDPLHDYATVGWRAGRSPGPAFDTAWYRSTYPDVAASDSDPLLHFIRDGSKEGRVPSPDGGGAHARRLIEASGLFDPDWYQATYGSALGTDDPIDHYLDSGWRRGFWPGPLFDGPAYLEANADVRAAGLEPLEHFIRHGAIEGRRAILFDDNFPQMELALPAETRALILKLAPDTNGVDSLARLNADPLMHLVLGAARGRDVLEVGFRGTASLELVAGTLAGGARSARILTDARPAEVTGRLKRVARRLGAEESVQRYLDRFPPQANADLWQPIWTESVGRDWLIQSHFYERDLKNKIGGVDLLVALSSSHHAFEILHFLERIAYLTDDCVIFDMPVVEPFERLVEGERVRFTQDDVWFAGDMSDAQAAAMAGYWADRGVTLGQFDGHGGHLTRHQVAEAKLGGVWWWFVGRRGLDKLLALVGLAVVDRASLWDRRSLGVLARKTSARGASPGPGSPP